MSVQSFIQSILPYAQQTSASTGLPLDFIVAQTGLETGWGTANVFTNKNNPGGLSDSSGTPLNYPDLATGFAAYTALLQSPRYAAASQQGTDPTAIADYLQMQGYNPFLDYGSRIASVVPQVDAAFAQLGNPNARGPTLPGNLPATSTSTTGTATTLPDLTVSATTPATSTSSGGILSGIGDTITSAVQQAGLVLLGLIVIGLGIWMLASRTTILEKKIA